MENDETYEESVENDYSNGSSEYLSEGEEESSSSDLEEMTEEDEESSSDLEESSEVGEIDLGEVTAGDLLAELSIIDGRLEAWETVENTPYMSRYVGELNFTEGSFFMITLAILFMVGYWFIAGRGE